jgi:hypothetical protein
MNFPYLSFLLLSKKLATKKLAMCQHIKKLEAVQGDPEDGLCRANGQREVLLGIAGCLNRQGREKIPFVSLPGYVILPFFLQD